MTADYRSAGVAGKGTGVKPGEVFFPSSEGTTVLNGKWRGKLEPETLFFSDWRKGTRGAREGRRRIKVKRFPRDGREHLGVTGAKEVETTGRSGKRKMVGWGREEGAGYRERTECRGRPAGCKAQGTLPETTSDPGAAVLKARSLVSGPAASPGSLSEMPISGPTKECDSDPLNQKLGGGGASSLCCNS